MSLQHSNIKIKKANGQAMIFYRIIGCVIIFGVFALSHNGNVGNLSAQEQLGEKKAILFAVPRYQYAHFEPLEFVRNDAESLAATLKDLGEYKIYPFYSMEEDSQWCPNKNNLEKRLENILSGCNEADTVLIYFSGHGAVDSNDKEKTYLVPYDAVIEDFSTYVSTGKIRDALKHCKAKHKFLFIDSCFAGGEKSAMKNEPSAEQLGMAFQPNESDKTNESNPYSGVITLASCTKGQKSHCYHEKNMSLFTYWLNEGLKGHADSFLPLKDISIQELYEFVRHRVARSRGSKSPQDVVLIQGGDVVGEQIVIDIRPVEYKRFLENIANLLITMIQEYNKNADESNGKLKKIERIGVVPFRISNQLNATIERSNLLLTDFAKNLHVQIQKNLHGKLNDILLDYDAFMSDLNQNQINPNNILSQDAAKLTNVDALVLGQIMETSEKNGFYAIECKLFNHKTRTNFGESTFKGIAALSPVSLAVNYGISTSQATDKPSSPRNRTTETAITLPVQRNTEASPDNIAMRDNPNIVYYPVSQYEEVWNAQKKPHPLLDRGTNRSFDAWIEVKRKGQGEYTRVPFYSIAAEPNNIYVPLEANDVYRIMVMNHSSEPLGVGLRLLVDGLGTLFDEEPEATNQEEISKFAVVDSGSNPNSSSAPEGQQQNEQTTNPRGETSAVTNTVRKQIDINDMTPWLLAKDSSLVYTISGFFTRILDGTDSMYNEFKVSSAADSFAAKKGYTDQLGMITFLFYRLEKTRGQKADTGTVPGDVRGMTVQRREGVQIAKGFPPLEILTIRYASLNSLQQAGAVPVPLPSPAAQ